MKKLLLIGYLFLAACQPSPATPTTMPDRLPTATLPPTPVPATLTPEPTLTPGPTATPFPRLFTNEFDTTLAGWVILQAGNESIPNIKTENNSLILQMDSPYTWLYALYGAQDYASVRIDTQFTNRALTPASAGLLCRYSEQNGWYEFNVFADGTYNVLYGRWLAVGITEYTPIADGTSDKLLPSGSTQTIGLACIDSTLTLYINETLFRRVDVSRFALTEGKVGLAASAYENIPIIVGFERVTISEP
jgi:hypothetical protein